MQKRRVLHGEGARREEMAARYSDSDMGRRRTTTALTTRSLAFVTIACALLACVVCCHRDDPAAHARATASKIEARWNERTAALTSTDPKRLFGERFDALVNVLGECSQAD